MKETSVMFNTLNPFITKHQYRCIVVFLLAQIYSLNAVAEQKPSVDVNQALGTIVVRAYPDAMKHVDKLIDRLRNIYDRQVVIETKLIEVRLNRGNKFGLDLNLPKINVTDSLNGIGIFNINKGGADKAIYNPPSGNVGSPDKAFQVFLNYLQHQGSVTVLSSPRIVTMNKQKAIMKVGEEKFYALDSNSTTSVNSSSTQTNNSINTKPFFSGIALDVTPEIVNDNEVILHIHPIVSEVTPTQLSATTSGADTILEIPQTSIRESDQIIKARNGEFIAIGGLIKRITSSNHNRLPGGQLDKSNSDTSDISELVIVMMPKIVDLSKTNVLLPDRNFGKVADIHKTQKHKYLVDDGFKSRVKSAGKAHNTPIRNMLRNFIPKHDMSIKNNEVRK